MMADLFSIGGATIDPTLEGFSQNRIEWFLHLKVHDWVSKPEDKSSNESGYHVLILKAFKDYWAVGHSMDKSFEVTFR